MRGQRLHSLVSLGLIFVFISACADLTISEVTLSPTCPTTKTPITFKAVVRNVGLVTSEPSLLAFKVGGETYPRIYKIPKLPLLEPYLVERRETLGVAQHYQNTVIVDVKNTVNEVNEDNNVAKLFYTVSPAPDTTGLTNFTYNEMLATILRGLLIDDAAAQKLNVRPGYYHIGDFRVWTQVNERVKVLNIEKNYAAMAVGASTFPVRNEPWVFSIIEKDEWGDNTQSFSAKDFFGHIFKYEVAYDGAANCWNVLSAVLDCVDVKLSLQTYGGGSLMTCGWDSEPAWTTP